jgi:hypothetical protein
MNETGYSGTRFYVCLIFIIFWKKNPDYLKQDSQDFLFEVKNADLFKRKNRKA